MGSCAVYIVMVQILYRSRVIYNKALHSKMKKIKLNMGGFTSFSGAHKWTNLDYTQIVTLGERFAPKVDPEKLENGFKE